MKSVFVDTFFWVAILDSAADANRVARMAESRLGAIRFLTTESVLIELLNYYAAYLPHMRQATVTLVKQIYGRADVEVVAHSPAVFQAGLKLYEARPDKGYSLTDCISMNVMRERGILEVLTHDKHFAQEGFVVLI